MTKYPASTGLQWLKAGMRLFFRQPGGLLAILFATMLAGILLTIPVVGPILLPSLIITILQACQIADQGERIMPSVLLTGFRGPEFKDLCRLGLVYMAVSLVLSGIAMLVIEEESWKLLSAGAIDAKGKIKVDIGDLQAILLIGMVQLAIWLGMIFSAPLVYWQRMKTFKAIFYSVVAVGRDLKAFLLMLTAWFIAFMCLSTLLMLITGNGNIGRTIVMWASALCVVILWCALYIGYRHIFGAPATPTTPEPTHIDTSA
jgi:hypothetical protein